MYRLNLLNKFTWLIEIGFSVYFLEYQGLQLFFWN